MRVLAATELLPPPDDGRRFSADRPVRLGDVDPHGSVRFDAIARYLQDVASDDAMTAGLPNALGWVVRRTMVDVLAPATLAERVTLTTFCTGRGRSWAERRTSIEGEAGARIEAVSLWVQVDIATGRPTALSDEFSTIYGEAAGDRVVSSKLSLPTPTEYAATTARSWSFRRSDLDQLGHVNNAAHWSVVEEVLQTRGDHRVGRAEVEYLAPVETADTTELLVDGDLLFVVADGRVRSAARWRPAE